MIYFRPKCKKVGLGLAKNSELRQRYRVSAVGKLGVVVSPDRLPRLVVDASISGITCHTRLPNTSLAGVSQCLPLSQSQERLTALVLDVSKAHSKSVRLIRDCLASAIGVSSISV